MIWLPWQNVQDQKSWHKSSDIARMNLNKYQDTCKKEIKKLHIQLAKRLQNNFKKSTVSPTNDS